ncbi:tetratricopeptide repeat protein [Nonomuraea polychroma]|uniref:tetratricopeptide repeat protein n=1 Tax=Nonomuraea polychroma TaxID=46176 RepID=UPI003D8D8A6B
MTLAPAPAPDPDRAGLLQSVTGSTVYRDLFQIAHVAGNVAITQAVPAEQDGEQIVEGDIPAQPPGFQLREELLQRLHARAGAAGAAVVSAVTGTPGVGKTLLAASYAWACQAARWPVVVWIPAETTEQITAGLAALADRLGQRGPGDSAAAAAQRAKAWLAATDQPALLVFDNATDVAAVKAWCPATGATRVVITTRNRAFLHAYEPVEVEVFTDVQAEAFLTARTGLDDPDGAARLAEELGYLPLALAQAAAVISRLRLSYAAYLELLRAFPAGEHLPAQPGDAYPAGTAEAILLSITQAEAVLPFAHDLLELLAVLSPSGVPLPVLHALDSADAGPVAVRSMLADLSDTSLITFSEDGTAVLMHRLIQRVLRERATHQGRLQAVLDRATTLLHGFNATLPDGPRIWTARAEAEMLIEQTTTVYRHTASDLTAALLNLRACCARYLHHLADLSRAIPLFEQTLTDRKGVLGADHPDTQTTGNNLALAYQAANDLDRAIPLLEEVLADSQRLLGTDHPDTLTTRNNLAGAYYAAEDLEQAIPLLEEVLADRERMLGADHPDTLSTRNNLASAYESVGAFEWAIPLYQQTLADQERVLGNDHPDTLNSRNNLAYAYQAAEAFEWAIPLYQQTLADQERVLGDDHLATLTTRTNLAGAYQEAGDLGRAIQLFEQTLADCERVLAGDHPFSLTASNNLARAYRAAGDLQRAIPLLEKVLAGQEQVLGDDHFDTLATRNNLAYAYQQAGDLARAVPLFQETSTGYERVLGDDHPSTLASYNNLAYAYQQAMDVGRAIPLFEQTLAVCERVLSGEHPLTQTVRGNLAACL